MRVTTTAMAVAPAAAVAAAAAARDRLLPMENDVPFLLGQGGREAAFSFSIGVLGVLEAVRFAVEVNWRGDSDGHSAAWGSGTRAIALSFGESPCLYRHKM